MSDKDYYAPGTKLCSVDGCKNVFHGRTLCKMHYMRLVRHGSTDKIERQKTPVNSETIRGLINYDSVSGVITRLHANGGTGCVETQGYIVISIEGKMHKAHRLAWLHFYGEWPPQEIDHINGIRSDNSIKNLRAVSCRENNRNRAIAKNNKSGTLGVTWDKRSRKWIAHIGIYGRKICFGYFSDKSEAECVRMAANIHYGFHSNHGRITL